MKDAPKKRGPEPARVKINSPWEKAVGDALRKERPKEGWPDPAPTKPKTKKKPA